MSTIDDRVVLRYQYRKQSGFDWAGFASELDRLSGPAKVDLFVS